jgi:molecular chaperone DnaK (HSP70)
MNNPKQMAKLLVLLLTLAVGCGVAPANSQPPQQANAFEIVERSSSIVGNDGLLVEDVGIEALGGQFASLLAKGCKVPCQATYTFGTAADNQSEIQLKLYRGTEKTTSQDHFLGTYVARVKPAPRGVSVIAVTLGVTRGDIIISATDRETGRPTEIKRKDQ